jgi:hypothetical protein
MAIFKTRTIRWGLGVLPETLQNMDVLDEPTSCIPAVVSAHGRRGEGIHIPA